MAAALPPPGAVSQPASTPVDAAALALVPGMANGAPPLRLERLPGGSINDSWRVDTREGRFVLRLNGPAWRRPGVDRAREQLLHEAAAAAGLAPRVVAAEDGAGALVCEYIEGRTWAERDFSLAEQVQRLGERLARLHSLEAPNGPGRFDPEACARAYLRQVSAERAVAAGAAEVLAGIRAAALEVDAAAADPRIIHGDLVHGNLLDGAQLWLLDWEYAQLADPLYDVACVLAYYPQARPHAASLLAAAGLDSRGHSARVRPAAYVYRALTWLWHQARGEPGVHPGIHPGGAA